MTYEERLKYEELRGRIEILRAVLEEKGEDDLDLRKSDVLELLSLVEETLEMASPARWDRMMDEVADEAARRAGVMVAIS